MSIGSHAISRSQPGRSTPKVRDSKAQRKNRNEFLDYYRLRSSEGYRILPERPGPGYRHLLTVQDVERFVALIPDWNELAKDLRAIVLDRGCMQEKDWHWGYNGWYARSTIGINAWPNKLEMIWDKDACKRCDPILKRLALSPNPWQEEWQEEPGPTKDGAADELEWDDFDDWQDSSVGREVTSWLIPFTEPTARAFQLLHVLLRSLGHHRVHRKRTFTQISLSQCERLACDFADHIADQIFPAYVQAFGDPCAQKRRR